MWRGPNWYIKFLQTQKRFFSNTNLSFVFWIVFVKTLSFNFSQKTENEVSTKEFSSSNTVVFVFDQNLGNFLSICLVVRLGGGGAQARDWPFPGIGQSSLGIGSNGW